MPTAITSALRPRVRAPMPRTCLAAVALILLSCLVLPAASAQTNELQYCYSGTCYDSLSAAERAMKDALTCGSELVPKGDPTFNQSGPVSRVYWIPPKDAIIDEDYYQFSNNWGGYCQDANFRIPNLQNTWCGSTGAAIADAGDAALDAGHCGPSYQYAPPAFSGASAVNITTNSGIQTFNTQQLEVLPNGCNVHIEVFACNPPNGSRDYAGCRFRKATDSHCPTCTTLASAGMPTFPRNVCTNPLTATITTRGNKHQPIADCDKAGNPCIPSTGAKLIEERDFAFGGFDIVRRYHSLSLSDDRVQLGYKWFYPWGTRVLGNGTSTRVFVLTPEFAIEQFDAYATDTFGSRGISGSVLRKLPNAGGWRLEGAAGTWVDYNTSGRFVRMYDPDRAERSIGANYNTLGEVVELVSSTGRKLTLSYSANRLAQIAFPVLGPQVSPAIEFRYNAGGMLDRVTHEDGTYRDYLYEEATKPRFVTGIVDELGSRVATYAYDANDRVILSTHHVGSAQVGKVELSYPSTSQTVVTMPLGDQVTYSYAYRGESLFKRLVSITDGKGTRSNVFDSTTGVRTQSTDRNGTITAYQYNTLHQLSSRTEGLGTTAQRVTQYTWDPAFGRVASISIQGPTNAVEQRTRFAYNARGQRTASCVVDPGVAGADAYVCGAQQNAPAGVRQTRFEYCDAIGTGCPAIGLLARIDGPRVDVQDQTQFAYWESDATGCPAGIGCEHRKSDPSSLTNAVGHATAFTEYDAVGRLSRVVDPNGVPTWTQYDARGRVVQSERGQAGVEVVTAVEYDDAGSVTRIVPPGGASTAFTYDQDHRLTGIEDAVGNRILYTLDAAGHRTREDTHDASYVPGNPVPSLKRTLGRDYDTLGLLTAVRNAQNDATTFTYDADWNSDLGTEPNGTVSDSDYDALNRLVKSIGDKGTGRINATTQFEYDARDNLRKVIDPKGLSTTYTYDGLDNLVSLSSPDTGLTTYGYDAAGNRTSQTDARGVLSTFVYDPQGRLVSISYSGAPQLAVAMEYDVVQADCIGGEAFAMGRLVRMTDQSGETRYCYDRRGNLTRKVQVTGGSSYVTSWAYDLGDHVIEVGYPSGARVGFVRDATGEVASVAMLDSGAGAYSLVGNVERLPFGPVSRIDFANGRSQLLQYDQNYRIDSITNGAASPSLDFTVNAVGNFVGLASTAPALADRTYEYDALSRIRKALSGSTSLEEFTYDATGNRLSQTRNGVATPYSYPPDSHRLSAVGSQTRSYDNAGNTVNGIGSSARTYGYDERNRLSGLSQPGAGQLAEYRYNGRGERVAKLLPVASANRDFVYDASGRLLGEYSSTGVVDEIVWLDDRPIAVIANALYYIEADHLGTPRAVIDPVRNVPVWRWDSVGPSAADSAFFGDQVPNADADGDTIVFEFNLRFPGQYFDAEDGMNYNYFRDYDPSTGRYVESDPIGLDGGISTFSYTENNAMTASDPYGLTNWYKMSSAALNYANGGRLAASGMLRMAASAGFDSTGVGAPAGAALAAQGAWNLSSAMKAMERGRQQAYEASCEVENPETTEWKLKVFTGVLPWGTESDDPYEPYWLDVAGRHLSKMWEDPVDALQELGTLGL